jgi:hypothetical protein
MTPFSALCQLCNLSHREAAEFLKVRPDTVKSWSSGRNPTPDGVLKKLHGLYERIEESAVQSLAIIDELANVDGHPDSVELGLASDDYEARSLGWPCVGAQAAVLARVVARSPLPVKIVPRGSTTATVGAADAHF